MAKAFMDEQFLLDTKCAERLYHDYAKEMPIFDYHSHLPIQQILDDAKFQNITQVWLYGDHYKWRAMRACGVAEALVTGDGANSEESDYRRFEAWAGVAPQIIGNPLYHWSHLELKRYFGVNELLSPKTARAVYNATAAKLSANDFSVRSIIKRSNVKVVCTTDDPVDDLAMHRALKKEKWGVRVHPAWRPDKALLLASDAPAFNAWTDKLELSSGATVKTWDDFLSALWSRHKFFNENGCRLSDYGIERPFATAYTASEIELAFKKLRVSKVSLTAEELEKYRSALLFEFLKMDAQQDWTQQLHFGAKRNNSSVMFNLLGPDVGNDSTGEFPIGDALVALLDRLDGEGKLARTILYTLNPKDYEMAVSVAGSFMYNSTPGKIQLGTAWWHNDHKYGMERQMTTLASIGVISRFVGMLTDSRSFLSYPRHEYFRRLLCNMLGGQIERGELPEDYDLIGNIVKDISYNNAASYFKMDLP
ncbi:uronate isomerase [Synergistales bacterium]|nr:uronate isomerase [Synergistales bacterium]